ncbi:MAG TPA: nucleoside deaminase [Candidatus Paceibacterota bacterium]
MPNITEDKSTQLIRMCQAEAEFAITEGNVPIASIITDSEGEVLVSAHNTQNTDNDPTAHAEINALRKLGKIKQSRYFDGCMIFSNAETCSMCMSACIKAHIRDFYFGAPAEPSMDPWVTMTDIAAKSKLPVQIHGPILGEECSAQILKGRGKIK